MRWLPIVLVLVLVALGARTQIPRAAVAAPGGAQPTVTIPPDYRDWPIASTSLALSYPSEEKKLSALARAHLPPAKVDANGRPVTGDAAGNPAFQNVFVSPAAYASFQKTGLYPDKTVFVLEVRASIARTSPLLSGGSYQGGIVAIRMEMRDDARYPKSQWAWFDFTQANDGAWVPVMPQPEPAANCQVCHVAHGAVQDSFTQFYPTLFAIAKAHGTVKPNYAK